MSKWMEMLDELGPEKIIHVYDPTVGMKGVAVIHTTAFGRCAGGTRMAPDISTEELVELARTMTYKYAIYGFLTGGGKAGIWADPSMKGAHKDAILRAFGKALKPLFDAGVSYGEDMGISGHDVDTFYEGAGLPPRATSLGQQEKDGEPLDNHGTGYSVVVAAKAACEVNNIELKEATVAIEGFGKAGGGVARYMAKEDAKVVALSTIHGMIYNTNGLDIMNLLELRKRFGDRAVLEYKDAQHLKKEEIYFLPVDVLIPGARPYVINKDNVRRVKAKIITPAANIPVTKDAVDILFKRGICSVPDFVCNIGGTVIPFVSMVGGNADDAFRSINALVTPLIREILIESHDERVTPMVIAVRKAKEKVLKMRAESRQLTDDEFIKMQRQNLKI